MRPLTNAWLAASAACWRTCGGTDATALCAAPDATASENADGACGSSSLSFESIRAWKIAPSAAVPGAPPPAAPDEARPEPAPVG